jgi:RNase P subunit RPR2
MSRREVSYRLVETTKRDHICEKCGKVIPRGSTAKVTIRRKYFHLTLQGRCQDLQVRRW